MLTNMRLKNKLIITFILGALLTASTGLLGLYFTTTVGEEGKNIGLRLAPLGDAAMEIKLAAANAHLTLEEVINQRDSGAKIEDVWKSLDESLWYADAILQGAENSEGHFYPSEDPQVREKISAVKEKLIKFISISHQRYVLKKDFGVGTAIDQEFDLLYQEIQAKLSQVRQYSSGSKALLITRLAGEAQYSTANGHLLLEELLSGDDENQLGDIVSDFNKALSNMRSLNTLTPEKDTQIIESITALIKMAKTRVHEAGQATVMAREADQKFNELFTAFIQEADEAEELIHHQMVKSEMILERDLLQSQWVLIIFSLVAFILALYFAISLTRSVTKQVGGDPQDLIEVAADVAKGKIDRSFHEVGEDLTGIKAAMLQMVGSLKAKQMLVEKIALGDLTVEVQLASEDDSLGMALQKMLTSLKQKVAIAESVADGDLSIQVSLTSEQDTLGRSLRKMVENLLEKEQLAQTIAQLAEEVALGDLSTDVQIASDEDVLGLALQKMVTSLRNKVAIAESVAEGDLGIQVPLASDQDMLGKSLRKMVENLLEKAQLAETVAEGDLSQQLVITSEKDILGKSLNKMTVNLNQLLREIVDGSTTLASSSEELSAISHQMANSSTEASTQTDSVANAVVEMTANLTQMAASSETIGGNIQTISASSIQTAQSMEEANKQVEEMGESIQEVASRAIDAARISTNARETSRKASTRGEKLNTSALEIGEVTEMIRQIAQQTNLLALNANIEAASAGDAGKGFGVVANEIKELAKQSAKAAEDIKRKITGIQSDTIDSVQAFGTMVEITEQINQASQEIQSLSQQQTLNTRMVQDNIKESSKGTDETAKSIDDIARAIQEFSLNNRELEKGSTEISKNISIVNQLARETSSAIGSINQEASQLARIASQLKESADKFRLAN